MSEDISVKKLAEQVYELQMASERWNDLGEGGIELEDIPGFFADLHKRISDAYGFYQEAVTNGFDLSKIVWMLPGAPDIESVKEGEGFPDGFPIALGIIVFDLLGLMKRIGVDPGDVFAKMAKVQATYGDLIDDSEGGTEESALDDSEGGTEESALDDTIKKAVSNDPNDQAVQKS
jgi:hypothetical protein